MKDSPDSSSAVIHRLIDDMKGPAADHTVRDVRLGFGYTAAQLDDESVGLAFTFRDSFKHGCNAFSTPRPLSGRPAAELLELAGSDNHLEAAVGLAVANALANRHDPEFTTSDILDAVSLESTDRVGMVGYFAPLMPRLKETVSEVRIFELASRKAEPDDILRAANEAYRVLPECDVAIITATSLINHTIDRLLEAAGGLREVIILGASTPMHAQAFAETATLLSGVIVDRPADVLTAVSEGGGVRAIKNFVTKVNRRINTSHLKKV